MLERPLLLGLELVGSGEFLFFLLIIFWLAIVADFIV